MLSRKRSHSPDEQGPSTLQKCPALSGKEHTCGDNCGNCITYTLESEPLVPIDEDSEDVYSVQLAPTVSPKDTSDTSWSAEFSNVESEEYVEYDLQSITHSDEKLMSNCDSSGSNDMLCTAAATVPVAEKSHEDCDIWADSSNVVYSSDSSDSNFSWPDYWKCMHCEKECPPLYHCCTKCFQLRKSYFPERPRPRRRKAGTLQQGSVPAKSPSSLPDADRVLSPTNESPEVSVDTLAKGDSGINLDILQDRCKTDKMSSVVPASGELMENQVSVPTMPKGERFPSKYQGNESNPCLELCFMCIERPKDGAFVHKKTVHVLSCYQCSLQVWNRTKKCPLCNKRPQNVSRLFYG